MTSNDKKGQIKTVQLSTFYGGGGGRAAMRLHQGLSQLPTIHSQAVTVEEPPVDAEGVHPLCGSYLETLLRRRWTKFIAFRKLSGLPQLQETFAMPKTGYRWHLHPVVQQSDLINLHWVTKSLDHRSFFSRVKQPVVWTLHDMNPWSGGYPYDVGFPREAYEKVIQENLRFQAETLKDFDRLTIVCPSQWLTDLSKKSSLLQRYRHEHIPNGLEVDVFSPAPQDAIRKELGLPKDKKVLLFVAAHLNNTRKGYQYLLRAFWELKNRMDTQEVVLAMAGGGTPEGVPEGIAVHALGHIKDPHLMAKVYGAVDLFVIPSLQDNLPNTILESLACGTPVVGFASGGITEIINDNRLGYLAKQTNEAALADAILLGLDDNFDREFIRSVAVERYRLDRQARDYAALYEDILK